jgi:hypothetical protein
MRHARRRRRSWRFTARAHWLARETIRFLIELAACFGILGFGCLLAWLYVHHAN